jgi:hypothetical protein
MTPRHLVSYWRRSRAVSDDRHRSSSLRCTKAPSSIQDEYGPLAHAPSALSVGGGSFANNMPSGSIDNVVSSFQQLLETLTQTISDLLRLLLRTTRDDSSFFDGVLLFDDGSEDKSHASAGKDEVAALITLELERLHAGWRYSFPSPRNSTTIIAPLLFAFYFIFKECFIPVRYSYLNLFCRVLTLRINAT